MNKVTKVSKKFIRKVKGVINYETVKNYLRSQGYDIMIYNNGTTNYLLQELELEEYANTKQAFTVLNDEKGVVLINYSNQNKLCSLLHETGHILLGHVTENEYFSETREQELEAETFAYHIMNYKKPNRFLTTVLCACLLLLTAFGIHNIQTDAVADFSQEPNVEDVSLVPQTSLPTTPKVDVAENYERRITVIPKSHKPDNIPKEDVSHEQTSVSDEIVQPAAEPQNHSTSYNTVVDTSSSESGEDYVYVTPSGEKYHRENCYYTRGKDCIKLIRIDAEKKYNACLICQP